MPEGLFVKSASHQVQDLAIQPKTTFDPRVKFVLMAAYQNDGKTVLKPLMSGQNAKTVADLFNNKALEVWLSNGENEFLQFDVDILKVSGAFPSLLMYIVKLFWLPGSKSPQLISVTLFVRLLSQ